MAKVKYYHFQLKDSFNEALASGELDGNEALAFIKETGEIWTHDKLYADMTEYLKSSDAAKKYLSIEDASKTYLTTVDAEKKYLTKSENTNANMNVDKNGALSNFSDNGQAYLAVRQKGDKFIVNTPYAGAAFGVKDDGTAAFSHKTYTTYDAKTGKYTGAKNTAVLQFAGPTGLRYAKNSGTANDVTADMYKYVGVIDSPDEFQRVYSAKQVDALISALQKQIDELKK